MPQAADKWKSYSTCKHDLLLMDTDLHIHTIDTATSQTHRDLILCSVCKAIIHKESEEKSV